MRKIERSTAFKRDYKRIRKTPYHSKNIDALLATALGILVKDRPLPEKNRDHNLTGNWIGYRECHIKPDLLLVYQKVDKNSDSILRLVRLGTHSELFR